MRRRRTSGIILILIGLVLISNFFVTAGLVRVSDNTPQTVIDLTSPGKGNGNKPSNSEESGSESKENPEETGEGSGNQQGEGSGESEPVQNGQSGSSSSGNGQNGQEETRTTAQTVWRDITTWVSMLPNFEVTDNRKTWTIETEVEIFKVTGTEDGSGVIEIAGGGDKTLYPGSSNSYSFKLSNTGNVALDYWLNLTAWYDVGDHDVEIPILVKLCDQEKQYYLGSETEWVPVMDLNQIVNAGVLAANHFTVYTLEWMWPFETEDGAGDAFDTLLGNLAVNDQLELTIAVSAMAAADDDPYAEGGLPLTEEKILIGGTPQPAVESVTEWVTEVVGRPLTGDSARMLLWAVMAVISLAVGIFLLVTKGKERKNNEDGA